MLNWEYVHNCGGEEDPVTRSGDRRASRVRHGSLARRLAGCPTRSRRVKGSTRGASEPGRTFIRRMKELEGSAKRLRDKMVRDSG
jgi:hypothetical protein